MILVKDQNGNIAKLDAKPGFMPPGWEVVPQEELPEAELSLARKDKMDVIRSERDARLLENDKQWLIKSKKGESTTALETEAQALRDLPETAEEALNELESVQEINDYDAFEGL